MLQTKTADLEEDLTRVGALVARPVESPQELASILRQIYHAVFDLDLELYDAAMVRARAPELMQRIFAARMELRDRIADWHARGFMTREVQNVLRDVFRIARYGVDMLGEMALGHQRLSAGQIPRRAFTGREFNTQVHPNYYNGRNIPFQSGDVLLMRGSAHNSAAIARIGDVDTQFSHLAIIHIDKNGKPCVVEALIEDGSVINTLEHVLDHGAGRAVVYRHRDPALAARAAELAHTRVNDTIEGKSRPIPYDFSMRLRGRRKLFCSKLVQQAFLDASGGKVILPPYRTRLDLRNRKFFRDIGVRAKETFTPGDIDLDPSFDLVAEWQDFRVTSALRRQDMIMTKFFEWMETRGWNFKEDFIIKLVAVFGRGSSYLSKSARNLISGVVPKVPRNMRRSCIATIVMLHKSAEGVVPTLIALEKDYVLRTGRPLHPRFALEHLEHLRDVSRGRIGYLKGP